MTHEWDLADLSPQEEGEARAAMAHWRMPGWAVWYADNGFVKGRAEGRREGHAEGYARAHADCYEKVCKEGHAEGRKESLDMVRKRILREVSSGPDPEAAGNLAERLEPISDLGRLMEIYGQIRGGMTGPELLAWMDAPA